MIRIFICTGDLLKRHLKMNILFMLQIIITMFIFTGFIGQIQYLISVSDITNTFNDCEAYYYYPYQSADPENTAQKIIDDSGISNVKIGDILHMFVCINNVPTGIIAYNSVTIDYANIKLESGKWFNECENDSRIPVISTNSKYRTGEKLIIKDLFNQEYEAYICGSVSSNERILSFNKGSYSNISNLNYFVSYPDVDLIFPYNCNTINSISDNFCLNSIYNAPSGRVGQIIIPDSPLDYTYLSNIFRPYGAITDIKLMAENYNKNNRSDLMTSGIVLFVFSVLTITGIGGINGIQNRINKKYYVIWYMLGLKTTDCAVIELLRVLSISLFSFIVYIALYYLTPLRNNMEISTILVNKYTFLFALLFIIVLCTTSSVNYIFKLGKGNIISAYKNQD